MSTISAGTTTTTGYVVTSDTTGALVLKTGASGTTAVTVGSDQSVTFAGSQTFSGGTANGVLYLNGSKAATSGSALTFDGTSLGVGTTSPSSYAKAAFVNASGTALYAGGGTQGVYITGDNSTRYVTYNASGSFAGGHIWQNGNTEVARLDLSGNFGIGTTSPAANTRLTLSDTNSAKIRLQGGTNQNGIVLAPVGSASTYYLGAGTGLLGGDAGVILLDVENNRPVFYVNQTSGELRTSAPTYTTFFTNGSERARINSSGNLLLGTTSIYNSERLVVDSNGGSSAYNSKFVNSSTSNTTYSATTWSHGQSGTAIGYIGVGGSAVGNTSFANNFVVGTQTSSALVFNTGDAERARIDSGGRLLLGTTASYGISTTGIQLSGGAATGRKIDIYSDATTHMGLGIDLGGGPYEMDVYFADGGGSGKLAFGKISSANPGTWTELARIDASGQFMVGTTSALGKVTIAGGKTIINSGDSGYGQFQIGNTTSGGEASIAFISGATAFGGGPTSTNGDTYVWAIGASVYGIGGNNWGIGNKGVGNYVAKIAFNSTSWTFSSDERLKDLDGEITNAVEKVSGLRAVYYTWKSDESKTRKVGLIAQDVLAVLPEAVDKPEQDTKEDGTPNYLGLGMSDVVPLLVAAIKEQQALIESLTQRIAALEGQ